MWWAIWTSLGIIVTLFACMAQRLVSSMRPTMYASAASCRHIMALPWKCKSYLPTSRAISQTNLKKGSFLMRSSVLFWNCQISQQATVPGWYFLVFFTLPAQRNSFQGALPPMVGQSFFLTGSSLPESDSPASTASWANCQVGNDNSDLPTFSSHLASSTHLSASSILFSSSLTGEGILAGDGWCTGEGASILSLLALFSAPWTGVPTSPCPSYPSLVLLLFWPCYKTNRKILW